MHLATITLPTWCCICCKLNLKPRLIPHDVVTWWNLAYDMMKFVCTYKVAVNKITANKSLKLRRYELNGDDWDIIEDLVSILKICHCHLLIYTLLTLIHRSTKKPHSSSHKTASIAAVIPAMDKLNNHLNSHTQWPYHPAIQAAMRLSNNKIIQYYPMTSLLSAYQIVMGKYLLILSNLHADNQISPSSRS